MKNWIGRIGKAVWDQRADLAVMVLAGGALYLGLIDVDVLFDVLDARLTAKFNQRH